MKKLLTIDDEHEFTNLITHYFGPRGFAVLVANDGDKGLELALREKPHVCLIDLKMPGLHGDQLLTAILKDNPSAKCIMITASEGEGKTRQKLLELGAFACFDKPITSLVELHQTIQKAVGEG